MNWPLAQDASSELSWLGMPPWVPSLVAGVVAMFVVMRLATLMARLLQGAPGTPRALRGEARRHARRGEHERAGDLFRAAGDYEEAIEQYKIANLPNKAADVLLTRGNPEAAAPLFERAQMWEPAADAFRKAGNLKRAEANFLKAGKKSLVARMYEDAGEHGRAASFYRETGKLDKAADLLERLGRFPEAAELAEKLYFHSIAGLSDRKAATAREETKKLEDRVVTLYRRAEQPEKALEFYLRAGLYLKAADLCLEIGKADHAIELFLRAGMEERAAQLLERKGETIKAARLRGESALRKGELHSAARYFEESGEIRLAAEAYERLGESIRAAGLFERTGDPSAAAHLYAKAGDYPRAAALFESAGDLESALRCYESAKDDLKRAAILAKAGKYVRAGVELLKLKRWDEAVPVLQRIDAASPDAPVANALLGVAFIEKNMPRVALEKLDLAIAAGAGAAPGPARIECFYYRARALEELGSHEDAILAFEKVVAQDATFRDAERRLAELVARSPVPAAVRAAVHAAESANPRTEIIARPGQMIAPQPGRRVPSGRLAAASPPRDLGALPGEPRAPAIRIEGGPPEPATVGPAASLGEGRYRIMEELGRGGMGVVYKCQDTLLDRIVAYKVLSAQIRDFPSALDNFLREAKSAARLHHPNVVTIFDFGESEGGYYMTLEYVAGKNLRQFARAGPTRDALRAVLVGICEGLAYAHAQAVVHRDIKPSNILISDLDQRAKILDFGLAKIVEDASATASGVLGTPWYMSPEQVLGTSINPQSDIYSLGITLFEVLAGELPFKGRDFGYHHVHTIPPSPRTVRPEMSDDMAKIILKCIEKKPEDRFATATDLGAAIKAAAM